MIRIRQAETKKKVEEILSGGRATVCTHSDLHEKTIRQTLEASPVTQVQLPGGVPEIPPGMPVRKRPAPKADRKVCLVRGPCCETAELGTQTHISLPHVARDVLWTASCLDAVADCEDEGTSAAVCIPMAGTGLGVLDVDSVEDDTCDVAGSSPAGG